MLGTSMTLRRSPPFGYPSCEGDCSPRRARTRKVAADRVARTGDGLVELGPIGTSRELEPARGGAIVRGVLRMLVCVVTVAASQTVKDLTAGSGLVFEDVGEHELK